MIWFFAQQDKTTYEISQNYATKFEMQLMQKELEILKLEMRDFKLSFNTQIAKMEESNDSILELITLLCTSFVSGDQIIPPVATHKEETDECIKSIRQKQGKIRQEIEMIKQLIKKDRQKDNHQNRRD
ncbi:MAG: hypothetical protein ACYSYL_17025 [Planctomycetota bacterium]